MALTRCVLAEKIKAIDYADPHIVMVDLDGKPMPAYPINILSDFVVQVVVIWTGAKYKSAPITKTRCLLLVMARLTSPNQRC